MEKKELSVSAIENGTVIDHIHPKSVFQIIRILNLYDMEHQIFLGTNLFSKKYGKKGIIKVSNMFFKKDDVDKIALVAPTATLIVIRDFIVVEKYQVKVPDKVDNIVKCFNPNCITNNEKVSTHFEVIDKIELKLKCHYCEKITAEKNISFV